MQAGRHIINQTQQIMSIYTINYRIRSIDTDMDRRLKTSVLFAMLQEAAIAHTEELGMGREKTLDKGLLWIVTHQRAEISRMPEYDENIVIKSWPGENMHLIFPRYYSLETAEGEPLIKASALWALMDEGTRTIVFPENHRIVIDGMRTGDEIALPFTVKPLPCTRSKTVTVPYSFVDLNGHMNNTRYFDTAEDCVFNEMYGSDPESDADESSDPGHKAKLRAVSTEFLQEIRLGETFDISWGSQDGRYFFKGVKTTGSPDAPKEKVCFKLSLEYESQ